MQVSRKQSGFTLIEIAIVLVIIGLLLGGVLKGQELINIEDIGSLKVDFRLPESHLSRLQKGQAVELSADAMPGQTFKGVLDAIDPLLDASGRAISQCRAESAGSLAWSPTTRRQRCGFRRQPALPAGPENRFS